ncbi:MAG: homoserine O-succinyltransferase [Bacteroidales bacterium]|nr:homoserine O-succinyltransferase [Bacteroidales bacterium]
MPLNVPDNLPAIDQLKNENVFVMNESYALHQDIRPLHIAILNLMPVKMTTETHFLRILANNPIQLEITLMNTKSHQSKHTPREHLETFYKTFDEIKNRRIDGIIITGAPIEHLDFEEVDYWEEIKEIMDFADQHVTSSLYICWGAQAGLYHHYGIPKYKMDKKLFGVFDHTAEDRHLPLVRGFDDIFPAPHSRYTEVRKADIVKVPELQVVSESPEAGIYIVASKDGKKIFVTGHSEYDPLTLKAEYERDKLKGLETAIPVNYFPNNDVTKPPVVKWRSHANLLFSNWLNYYVYQQTPF